MSAESDINRARLAKDMGYNVAGFAEDLYLGAEVLIPDFSFGAVTDYGTDEEQAAYSIRNNKQFVCGRVIHISPIHIQVESESGDGDYFDDEFDRISFNNSAVMTRVRRSPHYVVNFILLTDDGLQIHKALGRSYDLFFNIPVD